MICVSDGEIFCVLSGFIFSRNVNCVLELVCNNRENVLE